MSDTAIQLSKELRTVSKTVKVLRDPKSVEHLLMAAADAADELEKLVKVIDKRDQLIAEPGPSPTTIPELIAWLREECFLFDWSDHILHKGPCVYAKIAAALDTRSRKTPPPQPSEPE